MFVSYECKAETPGGVSFPKIAAARKESIRGPTGLQSCIQNSSGELRSAQCDWEQALETGQRPEEQCDLVDGVPVSRASMAEDDDHARFVTELHALVSRL